MGEMQGHMTLIGRDFVHESITKAIGVKPDTTRKKDERLKNGGLFGHCEWGISTKRLPTNDIQPVLCELLSFMEGKEELLFSVAKKSNAIWNILIYVKIEDCFPIVEFPHAFITAASKCGATIGFDGYVSQG